MATVLIVAHTEAVIAAGIAFLGAILVGGWQYGGHLSAMRRQLTQELEMLSKIPNTMQIRAGPESEIEARLQSCLEWSRKPFRKRLRAASIGSFAGAGLGVIGVGLGVPLATQLQILAILITAGAGWQTRKLQQDPEPHSRSQRTSDRRFSRTVLALGSTAFAAMLCEGTAADWAAVYLRDSLFAAPAIAGLGFAVFSATMVLIRLTGNKLLTRFGARRLLPTLATITTIGFALGLASQSIWGTMAGFAALGIGLGSVVPSVFSAAGRLPGISPGIGVATVSAFGWGGFVLGPPLIGHLSSATSLTIALATLPVLTAYIAVATRLNRVLEPTKQPDSDKTSATRPGDADEVPCS